MFTILKKTKLKHQIVAFSRTGDPFKEEAKVDYKNDKFVYFFIGRTDNVMHAYGENAKESQEFLVKVDAFIKETYEKAYKEHDDVTVIAYSDHGHIDVEEPKVDINDYFKPVGLNVNHYVHLIESTFARFWFRNDKEREEVTDVLKKMEADRTGFILTQDYLDKYHCNFNSNEHGDLIFHISAPREFTNTIWGFGKTVRSAHGFEPTLEKHYGIFCSNKPMSKNRDFAYLVDVLPTVMEQLGISREGYTLRGKNIVDTTVSN
jgi:predicted AlkP superfamily pyrophosphatase or phosphodiesterase